MRHHHERKTAYIPQRDELAPGARAPRRSPPVVIEHEPVEVLAAAKVAPDGGAGVAGVVNAAPADPFEAEDVRFVAHEEPRPRPRGIGFNKFGDAINLADYADEDLSL